MCQLVQKITTETLITGLTPETFDTSGCEHIRYLFTEIEPLMRYVGLEPFRFKCALYKGYLISGVTMDAQLKIFVAESRLFCEAQSSSGMLFYNGMSDDLCRDSHINRDSAWKNIDPYRIVLTIAITDRVRLRYNKRLCEKIANGQDITFEDYCSFNMAPSVSTGNPDHIVFKKGTRGYKNNRGVDKRGNNDGVITESEIVNFYTTEYDRVLNRYLQDYEKVAEQTNKRELRAKVAGKWQPLAKRERQRRLSHAFLTTFGASPDDDEL